MTFETPAVVVGAGINGLGVARSLARARVPAWLVDSNPGSAETYTRAARSIPVASLVGEALIDELVRLGTTRFDGQRPVLLLTQEESVKLVSRHRDRLAGLYRFSLPAPDMVDALLHKFGFQRLAEQFGAAIPALVHVSGPGDLRELERLTYPVVVKPGARDAEYARRFKKAYRIATAAEAIELVGRILPVMPDVVVQEWTEGPDSNIHFCLQYLDRAGRATASFTGRKVRSWPPQVGGTASCVPAPEADAELAPLTTRFFQSAGVIGMAAMEYKRDARTGRFRMVEPTIGRTDYQAEIATLNGVNLPNAAYCAELGMAFPQSSATPRAIAWRVRSQDDQSAAAQHQRPDQGFERVAAVRDALWRRSDPVPYLAYQWQRIQRALRRRTVTRTMHGSQPARSKS